MIEDDRIGGRNNFYKHRPNKLTKVKTHSIFHSSCTTPRVKWFNLFLVVWQKLFGDDDTTISLE